MDPFRNYRTNFKGLKGIPGERKVPGAEVIGVEEIIEPRCPKELNRYLALTEEQDIEVEYPASNGILLAQKK